VSAPDKEIRIAWITPTVDQGGGYGRVASYLPGILQDWQNVHAVEWREEDWDRRISICSPRSYLMGKGPWPVEDLVLHTMFEAEPLPETWARIINRAGAVWVPSQWCKRVFIESGVERPIWVSGYGVNEKTFHYRPRAEGQPQWGSPYRFLWCGTSLGIEKHGFGGRKGGALVIDAFRRLNLPDSQLVLKVSENSVIRKIAGDDRISVISENLPLAGYIALLDSADCFVYPSHGEGFGLQPLEAMALGKPVIATYYSGMTEYLDDSVAILLPNRGLQPATHYHRLYGEERSAWARISIDDLCDRMKWVYEHRHSASLIGMKAASRVAEQWTWRHAAEKARATLETMIGG